MIFKETSIFTKEVIRLLSDGEYKRLQTALMLRPDAGDLIRGSGGLRKIRWNLPGRGKRGSLRVIYYWDAPDVIFMLLPYVKTAQENLTADQLRNVKRLVEDWLR